MKKTLSTLLLLIGIQIINAQNTVGLLSFTPDQSYDGYNLVFPHNQSTVYLLNNCGEIVHSWEDEPNFRPGNIAYLFEDGRLLKGKRDAVVTDDVIWAGGGGETVELRDWDNNLLWSFTLNDSTARLHHDFAITLEGNILMIAWERKSAQEAIEAGRTPDNLPDGELWPDYIFEVDPDNGEIVWEWHVWDHLIQDFDSTKSNYGVVADHPERVDINWDTSDGDADWMHSNALDYNAELDQVMLCVPTFHEFWIIDHTTSTEQAAGSRGGLSGRGGDLMYRWGNPATYQSGTATDQKLFYPHDAHWVDDFLDFDVPFYGNIAVFNNRVGADFSTANMIETAWNMYGWDYTTEDNVFLPNGFERTIYHPDTTALFSSGLSSVQFMMNGNALICSGRFGYSFEITPNNEIVWEYKTPLIRGTRAAQGDTLTINQNLTFRMKRYPTDFPAFDGRELVSQGYIELEPNETFCQEAMTTSITEISNSSDILKLFPNPTIGEVTVEWDNMMKVDIAIYDQLGRQVEYFNDCTGGRKYFNVTSWQKGLYVIVIDGQYSSKFIIH